MKRQILLGLTKDYDFAFGELEYRNNDYFAVSFFTVHPFDSTKVDIEEYVEDMFDGFDENILYDLCCEYDCAPSQLTRHYIEDHDIRDILDCSYYPEVICIGPEWNEWVFTSEFGGQCDLSGEMLEYTNEKLFNDLYFVWKNFHLTKMNQENAENIIKNFDEFYEYFNEEKWISDKIEKYIKEL